MPQLGLQHRCHDGSQYVLPHHSQATPLALAPAPWLVQTPPTQVFEPQQCSLPLQRPPSSVQQRKSPNCST
jgi:hypothetical protein